MNTVIKSFIDKETNKKYMIGDEYKGGAARCAELESLGYLKVVKKVRKKNESK